MVAHKCAIPMFVTGGIGGVHRGGETSEECTGEERLVRSAQGRRD